MTELLPIDTRPHRAKITAADFELLDRHGAFAAYRKTELIDGEIYYVNAQYRPHGIVKMRLYDALRSAIVGMGSPYTAICEVTLALSPIDRPEPDILLTSEPDGDGFVPLSSVALVIEVSDTTLEHDLGVKQRRYAAAGVPEYWVADVNARVIHRMASPNGDSYASRHKIPIGTPIQAATIDGLSIQTDKL